ncbi:MAG: Smr/MutS family protein [Legionellaceae bacterium]
MPNNKNDDDDSSLFQNMMRDVLPLSTKKKRVYHQPEKPEISVRSRQTHQQPIQPTPSVYLSNPHTLSLHAESTLAYGKDKLARKQYQALQQGCIAIEARLDLHGLTLDAAGDALTHFIIKNHAHGKRCLLVIHGKGGQDFNAPRLKNHVNHWLSQYPQILAFHSAKPKDGGTGAVYVLLKK